jgi:hypothetical protein
VNVSLSAFGDLRRGVRHRVRHVRRAVKLAIAILAASVVSTLTVDLGPAARSQAERGGSAWLDRPVRIGHLGIHLIRGRFVVEDLQIDGRKPGDRVFFTARRLSASVDWSRLLAGRPDINITSVELTDWTMLVEDGPSGHNFPRFTRQDAEPSGPRRFTTTLRYLRALRGQFIYEDLDAPWSIVAPEIDLNITNLPRYQGEATVKRGLVKIQDHVPMWVNMTTQFVLDGSKVRLEHIELESDGARSLVTGELDLARWPEMRYAVQSRVQFSRMREIFFRNATWTVSGEGDFTGTFRLFKGGHDLSGTFRSHTAGVDDYRFQALHGALSWTRDGFSVREAGADVYGGQARFDFAIGPAKGGPRDARFDVTYSNVDVALVSEFYELPGLRFAGAASGRNLLEWPLGRFADRRGDGALTIDPLIETMTPSLPMREADADPAGREWGPFGPVPLPVHLPVRVDLTYRFDPNGVYLHPSRFATEGTYVAFEGETAWGDTAAFRFHVTSRDWQESDQVLAGILTDFGSRTAPVPFGGRGEFDGVMTGSFRRPRVEGTFTGEDMRAWDTHWGDGSARIVVENSYVTVNGGVVRLDGSEIRADGLFSLGYPRRDGGEEIDARFRVTRRDVDSLRHAFAIDGYPVSGRLTGEFSLRGAYRGPIGFGAMTVDNGEAYGERFEKGTASLRFDGSGIRLDNVAVSMHGGTLTGAAFIGWNSTYSFNVDARQVPVERTTAFAYPEMQPSGLIEFTAGGSGTFETPRYDVRFRVTDLFVADEGVGQVTGTLALRDEELSGQLDIASPRLSVTGTGRILLTPNLDAELSFRFVDSSLDPYVRLLQPSMSPFTTAVASGSTRVSGGLADVDRLVVETAVERLDMRLFDYAVRNAGPLRLAMERRVVRLDQLSLAGEDTRLKVGGTIDLGQQRIALEAVGDANLGILQGFFRNVRGSGRAELIAGVNGPLYNPVFSGNATVSGGRIRHFSMPNSLDAINGTIHFDASGLRLDEVAATLGGGRVQFGGRIGLDGYLPGELNVVARGEGMQLRVLDGVRSTVDADLILRGNFQAPTVGGLMTVRSAVWTRRIDPTAGLFDFIGGDENAVVTGAASSPIPIRFDLDVRVPSTLRIENNLARLVASADLQLRGTYDRPLIFGRAEVDRGEVMFEGRRYLVTRGAIDFTNPTRIEPFFDVEAESRVRVPGQTYRVIVSAAGTMDRLQPQLSSDPPLPAADVVALLFSDVRREGDVELRAQRNANEREADILATRATQLVASPISAEVGRVVEQTFGVDSFQLTPSLIDPYTQSTTNRVNPSARVTIGKRISDRLYLTFSRSLSSSINDQLLLLEYDESDRLSWILSRNEDATYAIEVRVRHTF